MRWQRVGAVWAAAGGAGGWHGRAKAVRGAAAF